MMVNDTLSGMAPLDLVDVWSVLFRRQIASGTLPAYFLEGLDYFGWTPAAQPTCEDVNRVLNPWGWQAQVVPEPLSFLQMCEYFDKKIFVLPSFIRSANSLEYSKTPDFFSRCFSQVPLLFYEEYRKILTEFGRLSKASTSDNEQFLIWLRRLYWYSVEKGILDHGNAFQPIGVQLIDSTEERQHCLDPSFHKPYGMHPVIRTPIPPETYPPVYYVFETWAHVRRGLLDFERMYKNA